MTTATTARNNDKALNAYISAQAEAHHLLEMLTNRIDTHQGAVHPDHINWGHVSDLTRLIVQLEDMVDSNIDHTDFY